MNGFVRHESVFSRKRSFGYKEYGERWFPATVSNTDEDAHVSLLFDDGEKDNLISTNYIKKRTKKTHPSRPVVQRKRAKLLVDEVVQKKIHLGELQALEWDYAIVAEMEILQKTRVNVPCSWFPHDSTLFTMQACRYKWGGINNQWQFDVAYRKRGEETIHQYGFVSAIMYCDAVVEHNRPLLRECVLKHYKENKDEEEMEFSEKIKVG